MFNSEGDSDGEHNSLKHAHGKDDMTVSTTETNAGLPSTLGLGYNIT